MKLFTIPNLFTLGNLLCGCLAIVFAFDGHIDWSAYLVGIACVFDFLDGFLARILKSDSPIGKQLDSLADMVTFGVVPGALMYKLVTAAFAFHNLIISASPKEFGSLWISNDAYTMNHIQGILPFIAFLIPIFSALRLAKFNIDTRQTNSFIGVPTPANAILISSFILILRFSSIWGSDWPSEIGGQIEPGHSAQTFNTFFYLPEYALTADMIKNISCCESLILNPWFLIGVTILMSILLIAEIPLFALKFKSFGWKGNEIRYIFILLAIALIAVLHFVGIPLVILTYILLSVGNNLLVKKKSEPQ